MAALSAAHLWPSAPINHRIPPLLLAMPVRIREAVCACNGYTPLRFAYLAHSTHRRGDGAGTLHYAAPARATFTPICAYFVMSSRYYPCYCTRTLYFPVSNCECIGGPVDVLW